MYQELRLESFAVDWAWSAGGNEMSKEKKSWKKKQERKDASILYLMGLKSLRLLYRDVSVEVLLPNKSNLQSSLQKPSTDRLSKRCCSAMGGPRLTLAVLRPKVCSTPKRPTTHWKPDMYKVSWHT